MVEVRVIDIDHGYCYHFCSLVKYVEGARWLVSCCGDRQSQEQTLIDMSNTWSEIIFRECLAFGNILQQL